MGIYGRHKVGDGGNPNRDLTNRRSNPMDKYTKMAQEWWEHGHGNFVQSLAPCSVKVAEEQWGRAVKTCVERSSHMDGEPYIGKWADELRDVAEAFRDIAAAIRRPERTTEMSEKQARQWAEEHKAEVVTVLAGRHVGEHGAISGKVNKRSTGFALQLIMIDCEHGSKHTWMNYKEQP